MSAELRDLLAELVKDQPDHTIDLDREIARGRRRTRYRQLGTIGLVTVSVLGLTGGIVALRPHDTAAPTEPPIASSPTRKDLTWGDVRRNGKNPKNLPPAMTAKATAKSAALAAQLEQLTPEIAATPGARRSHDQRFTPDNKPLRQLSASVVWEYPMGRHGSNVVTLGVDAGHGDAGVPPVCTSMIGRYPCDAIVRLADGSTAYRKSYVVGGQVHEVRIERPDGTHISVSSAAQMPRGSTHDSVLSADRVFDIAKQITVTW